MPRLLKRFLPAKSSSSSIVTEAGGSIGIIFALSLLPLIGIVGLGVDYGVATSNKSKLDRAADAAAIAAVVTAKTYLAANPNQANVTNNAIAAGVAQATSVFKVNAGNITFGSYLLQIPQLTRAAQTFTSSIAYTAVVQNNFGKIFGTSVTNIAGKAIASADVSSYLDFYLMVDVSGSMGLPSTTFGMTQLANVNNDMYSDYQQGCQFACHFPGNSGWGLALSKNIQLRSDAVNLAVCSLLTRAASPTVPNQYRVGIYPFINRLATLAALTSNISSLSTAARCGASAPSAFTSLLDTGTTQLSTGGDPSTGTGSGGTHFEIALPQMKSTIATFSDGSSASAPRPFVFIVTDGMQNSQNYFTPSGGKYTFPGNPSNFAGYANANWDGSKPAQIDQSLCTSLKSAGATISILYIPYNQIGFIDRGGYVATENKLVNGFSPSLATPLTACASAGYFFTANTPDDITAALNAMFDKALHAARITQ